MKRTKIIEALSAKELEVKINNFFTTYVCGEIIDIKYTVAVGEDIYYSAMIFYNKLF